MVVAIAVAAQQNASGATVERQIGVALGVIGILTFLWAVARFFLKPLLHNWWHTVLASQPTRTADGVIEALDMNDRTRATARGFLDRLYADTLKQQQETRDLADANKDAIEFLRESNQRQGEAITRELGKALQHMAESTERQTRIMEKIQKELEDHSVVIARMDERIKMVYDGPERRQKPR